MLRRDVLSFEQAFPEIFSVSEDSSETSSSQGSPQNAIPVATVLQPDISVHCATNKSPAKIHDFSKSRLSSWEEEYDQEECDENDEEETDIQRNFARLRGGGSEGASTIARKGGKKDGKVHVIDKSDVNNRMGQLPLKIKKNIKFTTGGHVYVKFTYESVRDPTIKLDLISDRLRNDKVGLQTTRNMLIEQMKKLCQLLRDDKKKENPDVTYIDEFEKHLEQSPEVW
jgi:hypothetical protein